MPQMMRMGNENNAKLSSLETPTLKPISILQARIGTMENGTKNITQNKPRVTQNLGLNIRRIVPQHYRPHYHHLINLLSEAKLSNISCHMSLSKTVVICPFSQAQSDHNYMFNPSKNAVILTNAR
uniref:Uncharacterized protein n=1 Tax=Anopheles atroparvus TaxID=41427 RepID=A0AAG5DGX0_ANOAO